MKKSQVKLMFLSFLIFTLSVLLIYASSTLLSPVPNFSDDDGNLDFRGFGESSSVNAYDGTTSWNVTNGTLWTNVLGVWKQNKTIQIVDPLANNSFLFNYTNVINGSAEGEFLWNIQVYEQNSTGRNIQFFFAGNRTIKVDYADPSSVTTSPVNNFLSFNGHEINVVCTGIPSSGWNVTTVSLYTDISSSWVINQTHTITKPSLADVIVANFTINKFGNASIADGNEVLFACQTVQIKHLGTPDSVSVSNEKTSANRTLLTEYPAQVTLDNPADNNWSQNLRVNLNWTVVSAFGQFVSPFSTRIWTNESGEWLPRTGTRTANNGTSVLQSYLFQEKSAIIWGVQAFDGDNNNVFNFSVNRTINLDATNPTITIATANNSNQDSTVTIQFTPVDANLANVTVFTNFTGGMLANYTNLTLPSGSQITITTTSQVDGVFLYNITAFDTSERQFTTAFNIVVVDTVPPAVSAVTNISIPLACDQRNITFTTSEPANFTLSFDTDTDVSDGTDIVGTTTKVTSHSAVLDFNFNAEVTHFFNITVTDLAGNVNTSTGQTTFETPARVCSGFSQYAIYNSKINLSTIQNQSGADLIYIWNVSDQDWILHTAGISTNGEYTVGRGVGNVIPVVHLFENVNSTWFRNTTNDGTYRYNVSQINNFIAVPFFYNFGNLTESFMNRSRDFPSLLSNQTGNEVPAGEVFGPFNLTFFAGWNNSLGDWVSHNFNFTFNNATILEPCPTRLNLVTCMETFWVASDYNVSWNTSEIYSNWTR